MLLDRIRSGEVLHIPQAERYSSKDWFHNLSTIPSSRLLKRIRGVVIFNFFWSGVVFIVHRYTGFKSPGSRCHSLLGKIHRERERESKRARKQDGGRKRDRDIKRVK